MRYMLLPGIQVRLKTVKVNKEGRVFAPGEEGMWLGSKFTEEQRKKAALDHARRDYLRQIAGDIEDNGLGMI